MQMRKGRGPLLATLVLVASCGDDDEEATPTTTDAPATSAVTSTTEVVDPFTVPDDPADITEAYVEAEAARFWQTMPLPDLVPRIQPGKALVGWKAFLETGGEPLVSTTGATPFGALSITATRTVTVDWDDGAGSVAGPHEGSGGPHPEGDITWVYGRSGPRDIAVTQSSTTTWSIGEAGGTFSGRGTTSTLFGFPVEEVQAVRNR